MYTHRHISIYIYTVINTFLCSHSALWCVIVKKFSIPLIGASKQTYRRKHALGLVDASKATSGAVPQIGSP